jgi:hypothetical protein
MLRDRLSTEVGVSNDIRQDDGKAVSDLDHGRGAMTPTSLIRQQLEDAHSVADILDASYDAFDEMLSAFDRYQRGCGPFYAALIMAGPAAADGRNTVGAAPSIPPPERDRPQPPAPATEPAAREVAESIADLALLTARKLRTAAAAATCPADCSACIDAAQYADEVHALMTGKGP